MSIIKKPHGGSLRSAVFMILFFTYSIIVCGAFFWGPYLLPQRASDAFADWWRSCIGWLERNILGLHYQCVDWEHLPEGPCIIAAKHQAAWETFKLHALFDHPAIVLKQELINIPIWGKYLEIGGAIPVDRSKGREAIPYMLKHAKAAADRGQKIIIFPQGTRVKVGEHKPYKGGVAKLYSGLDLPVVPLALNAGLFWRKGLFNKRGGMITLKLCEPIPAGLSAQDMMAQLEEVLERESDKLCLEV